MCRSNPTSTRPKSSKCRIGPQHPPAPCEPRSTLPLTHDQRTRGRRWRNGSGAPCPTWSTRSHWRASMASRCSRCLTTSTFCARSAAAGVPRGLRRPARPAALPDPQAELQHPRHSHGRPDPAVPDLRRRSAPHQPRTGGRVPADGGDADRDQVAHAVAAAQDGRGRRGGRPARRTGTAAARIRADQDAGCRHQRPAAGMAGTSGRARSTSSSRSSRAFPM